MPSLSDECRIEISGRLARKIDDFCARNALATPYNVFEIALNAALDAEGCPRTGNEQTVSLPTYWYVTVLESGRTIGHVGPISDILKAQRAMLSWRTTGRQARIDKVPMGKALTNRL